MVIRTHEKIRSNKSFTLFTSSRNKFVPGVLRPKKAIYFRD